MSGLYRDHIDLRRARVASATGLDDEVWLEADRGLSLEGADLLVENVVGLFSLPLCVATYFLVDGVDRLIPMVVEEQSVVAGASRAARMARARGGFLTEADPPLTVAQVELREVPDTAAAVEAILAERQEITRRCQEARPGLTARGGGCRDLECRPMPDGTTLVIHLLVDCADAMGGFTVTAMAQSVAPMLAKLAGGRPGVQIVTNLADRRLVRARCCVPASALTSEGHTGEEIIRGVVAASRLAAMDIYRAATHNKGILNGIDALMVATGNDWRAVEAGAHAFASRSGRYAPLSRWEQEPDGVLQGTIEIPLAVGTVGRVVQHHPTVQQALRILGVHHAPELARVAAAVGLASNLAALVALSSKGVAPLTR